MTDKPTEQLRERLVAELADAPQGTRDSQMPPSPNPFPEGQIGPGPSDAAVRMEDGYSPGIGEAAHETGEEADPGVANAGGVDNPNTDGMTDATGRD